MEDNSEPLYSDVLTQAFTFTNPAPGLSEEQTVTLTTSIATNVTEFSLTLTQSDPYNGPLSTVQTQVTITNPGRGNNTAGGGVQSTTPAAGQSSNAGGATTRTPPNSTAPASSTGSSTQNSSGISTGAAAGIGIGCAAAGALLAAVIVLLCIRRRRRSHVTRSISRGPSMRANAYSSGGGGGGGGVALGAASKAGPTPTVTVEKALEPPMQDSEVQGLTQRLGTAIKNHAQSYYVPRGTGPVSGVKVSAERVTALLGASAPVRAEELAGMLASAQARMAGVRFLIAWSILRNMNGDPETSLLPPELAESLEVIHAGRARGGDKGLMLSRWRQMTAALMAGTYDHDTISTSDPRQRNIRVLVDRLDAILAPLASPAHGADSRRENLEEVVKRGARFAYMLFTQPTEWEFSWDRPARERGEWVVFPEILRVTDEAGTRLAQPQAYGAAQVVNVDTGRA